MQLDESNSFDEIFINDNTKKKNGVINKSIKLLISKNLYIYFSPEKNYISLTPIISANNIDLLFDLYNLNKLNISKQVIQEKIKLILQNSIKLNEIKNFKHNGIKIQKSGKDIKIIDNKFINDCLILSKINNYQCLYNIANKISTTLFKKLTNFEYLKKDNSNTNSNFITVGLKLGKIFFSVSKPSPNAKLAKLNATINFINKFLPDKYSIEIINNIMQNIQNKEINEKENKNEFLQNKRNINNKQEEYKEYKSNILPNNKKINFNNKNYNNYLFKRNTNNKYIPVDEILLGDLSIVDEHLNDFKYSPMKMMEMIKNSEKYRGYDFTFQYSQLNNKNYFYKIEIALCSQKLGIKVKGFGNTKQEAENKCALNCLTAIFRNKFKTYYELHNYFENKNGKYLDIIL